MLKVEVNNKSGSDLPLSPSATSDIIKHAVKILNVAGDYLIETEFVEATVIQSLNLKFRKVNKPTDVLSFPQIRLETGKIELLGAMVICPAVVFDKKEKLEDVIKHGLLHLLGYDHKTDKINWDTAAKKIGCEL